MSHLIKIGQITAPHGIKGCMKVHLSLEMPQNLERYKPIYDQKGHPINIQIVSAKKNQLIVKINGISDRTMAENLRGTNIYIDRNCLPPLPSGQYYYCDLVGLTVLNGTNTVIGKVKSVENYGASDILVVTTGKKDDIFIAFTQQTVPSVDLKNKTITVLIPDFAKEEA